jgi:hypothetical protein
MRSSVAQDRALRDKTMTRVVGLKTRANVPIRPVLYTAKHRRRHGDEPGTSRVFGDAELRVKALRPRADGTHYVGWDAGYEGEVTEVEQGRKSTGHQSLRVSEGSLCGEAPSAKLALE